MKEGDTQLTDKSDFWKTPFGYGVFMVEAYKH